MKCPNCNKSLWFVRNYCPFCKTNITAPPRPNSVTVLCWFFMVMGCSILFLLVVNPGFRDELLRPGSTTPWQRSFVLTLPVLYLILGGCTLVGHNWARWALVVWAGVNAIRSAIISGAVGNPDLTRLVGPMLLFVVAAYYLFRPQARAFFRGEGAAKSG